MSKNEDIVITCCKCHGKGVYDVAVYSESGEVIGWNPTLCEVCHGTGKISLQFYEDIQKGVQEMNTCKCGGEVHLDYRQGEYTGQHWYAICNDCETEYPLKSDNRIDAEREWNNRKEGKTMKSDFEEIEGIAIRIMEEAGAYREDEAEDSTVTRIRYIKEFADTIIGITGSMELELGESEEGLK